MFTRREAGLGLMAGLMLATTTSAADEGAVAVSETEAHAVLDPWGQTLFEGDPARVAETLAPEFQVLRANGVGQGKAEYLQALPRKAKPNVFSQIVGTRGGDVMVLRYLSDSEQEILGQAVQGVSPRLSVFRRQGERWLMVAHANFAQLA